MGVAERASACEQPLNLSVNAQEMRQIFSEYSDSSIIKVRFLNILSASVYCFCYGKFL